MISEGKIIAGMVVLLAAASGGYWQGRAAQRAQTEKYKAQAQECVDSLQLCHGNRDSLSSLLEDCDHSLVDCASLSERNRQDIVARLKRANEMQASLEAALAAATNAPLPPDPSEKIREMARRMSLQMQGLK